VTTAAIPWRLRLGARARKWFLVVHIIAAALWFGVDIAFGVLVSTAALTDDPRVAGTALQVLELFAIWPMLAASLLCLASGVVLGLGSRYGLLRYWWVTAKLAINVLMTVLIAFALRPGIYEAGRVGRRIVDAETTAGASADLLAPVVVAPTLLLTAYLLSVFKPGARVPWPSARPTARHGNQAAITPATVDGGSPVASLDSMSSGSVGIGAAPAPATGRGRRGSTRPELPPLPG
jgi:uncharacterized membrane protein